MNLSDTLSWLKPYLPGAESANGTGHEAGAEEGGSAQPLLLAAAIPLLVLAIAGGAGLLRKRGTPTAIERVSEAAAKAKSVRPKPKSRARYYAIGALIAALERERTRKAVVLVLRYAQRHS